jgi:uncharacterized membrane protein YkvA (DUF1232 family)
MTNNAFNVLADPIRLMHYLGRLMSDPRVPLTAKLKVVGAGLYTWIDGDLVPDPIRLVPGLGYLDDAILVVHGVQCLIAETDKVVATELWPGNEESLRRVLSAVKWLDSQLYERARGWVRRGLEALSEREQIRPDVIRIQVVK